MKKRSTFRCRKPMRMVNVAVMARRALETERQSGKPWLVERSRRLLGR